MNVRWVDEQFWAAVAGYEARTLICAPGEVYEHCAALVAKSGLAGKVKVLANIACPADQVIVIDESAIEASQRQAMQRRLAH